MKRTILALFMAVSLIAPMAAKAQVTTSTPTQEEMVAQMQTLLTQLIAMVQQLTEQLNAAIAAQNAKLDTIQSAIPSTVTIIPAQTQTLGMGTPTIARPELSVTLGTPVCNRPELLIDYSGNSGTKAEQIERSESILIPFTTTGDWQYGVEKYTTPRNPYHIGGGTFTKDSRSYGVTVAKEDAGEINVTVQLGMERSAWNSLNPITEYTFTDTVTVNNVCD